MAFTLSSATTIDGIINSYEVTGSGNLDDLATACSGIGMSRANNVIAFNPGTNRILAISGTLTEERSGNRQILILGGGHICFAYGNGSVTTLGTKNSNGIYTSTVDIIYQNGALTLGSDVYSSARGKCFAGAGTFNHISGSLSYNHASPSHLDVWKDSTLCTFDNVKYFMTSAGNSYTHIWKPSGKTVTTDKTVFNFLQRPMEGGETVTQVTPFYIDTGFRWLNCTANTILRVISPSYPAIDTNNANQTCRIDVIDPLTPYIGWINNNPIYSTHAGIKRILRTLKVTFTDLLGNAITNGKLVTVFPNGTVTADNFTAKTVSKELLQSTRASGVAHDVAGMSGTGYTNEGNYSFYYVGYGYSGKNESVSLLSSYIGNVGVVFSKASDKASAIDSTLYESVLVSPFSFSIVGDGTLTISSNATVQQACNYLFKLAYDNADQTFWRALNHNPANLVNGFIDIGSINIIGIEFLTGKIQSSGTLTANGTISNLSIVGNVSQATPTNISNVTISGTLTYNTNADTSITLTNTTIGTVENIGTGIVTISRDNTSSITTYTDAEINFLDSSLSAVGITSATIYQTENDRDTGANPGATFTSSLDFKYGSVVSGVTMQDTVYLRVVVGSVTLFAQITLVLGSNTIDLGFQGQLSAINAKVDTTNTNLPKVNRNVIKASKSIPAGETF